MKARFFERSDIVGISVLAITILGIVMPRMLLAGNLEHIPHAVLYYRYFFIGSLLASFFYTGIILLLPRSTASFITFLLCTYALLVFAFDLFNPLSIGPIVKGTESGTTSPAAGFLQLVLLIPLFLCVYFIPRKLRNSLAWLLAGVFLVLNTPFFFAAASPATVSSTTPVRTGESTPDFNVYHLVFDSYYGPWLQWSLSELKKDPQELAGFIHYRRNVSNYWHTVLSYPSFMSGTMYAPGTDYREWRQSTNQNSIIEDMHARGFTTYFYGFGIQDGMKHVQQKYMDDPGGTGIAGFPLIMDCWMLRVAPVLFRYKVLHKGTGPATRFARWITQQPQGLINTLVSYRQFQKFLSDEKVRSTDGNYVHAYFYPPHPPYQLDRNGNYIGTTSYSEQTLLATNMMLQFIHTLKTLGRFDKSLIIINADHGNVDNALVPPYRNESRYAGDPLRCFTKITPDSSKEVLDTYLRYNDMEITSETLATEDEQKRLLPAAERYFGFGMQSGAALEIRFQPLLLVKPRGISSDGHDFVVNDSLVQLLDLRGYVAKAVDDGTGAYPERETVRIHIPLHIELSNFTSQFGQYEIHPDGVWKFDEVFEVNAVYQ